MFTSQAHVKSVKIIHIHDHHTMMGPLEANFTYILDIEYKNGDTNREIMRGSTAEKKFGQSIVRKAVRDYHPKKMSPEESNQIIQDFRDALKNKKSDVKNDIPDFVDDRKNSLNKNDEDIYRPNKSPILTTDDMPEESIKDKWIMKCYNPDIYHLQSMSAKNIKPSRSVIEIDCHTDDNGPYIEYRLIGADKKEVSGIIRQEHIPDALLPNNVDEIIKNDENYKKWLNLILDVTTKRGHTNTDHIPPPVDLGPFRPYVQPKGWPRYDKEMGMYFYDNSLSQHLKQAGLFATKTAAVALVGYVIYQGLKPS